MARKLTIGMWRSSKLVKRLKKFVATELAKTLQQKHTSTAKSAVLFEQGVSLYAGRERKYITAGERQRFLAATKLLPTEKRLFCVLLACCGSRISEALAITPSDIDLTEGLVALETLKRRRRGVVRQVPLHPAVLHELDLVFGLHALQRIPEHAHRRLWPWSRVSAWRYVKQTMSAAGIYGKAATPKGLRHGFGVAAFATVPPHLVQRWLGHADLRTTAIYGDVSGCEEQAFASRMWQHWQND